MRFVDIRGTALLLLSLSGCVSPPNLQVPPPALSPAREAREKAQTLDSPYGSSGAFYTTLTEVLKQPTLFDGQRVRLRGRIARAGAATFNLTDSAGNTVKIVTAEPIMVREGTEVVVTGTLVFLRPSVSSPVSLEVRNSHVVSMSPGEKVPAQPGTPLRSERSPSSPPAALPVPRRPADKDEGRIF